jgi:transcription initiation factor TFIIIB Brf1 subunit/transcription initiation factor TFIIB
MKCTKCKKEGAYKRFKTNEIVCRYCGYIEQEKKQKKEVKDGS